MMNETPCGTEFPPSKYLVGAHVDSLASILFIGSLICMPIQTCLYPCASVCTLPFICIQFKNRFSHFSHSRCWQKHSITLRGCKFPAHWSSMTPQRSKTDWNLCSHSGISSVTRLCQHLSTVPPNKLLAASFQAFFTFTGTNFSSLLLPEVMLACMKLWSKELWSSDLPFILCVN